MLEEKMSPGLTAFRATRINRLLRIQHGCLNGVVDITRADIMWADAGSNPAQDSKFVFISEICVIKVSLSLMAEFRLPQGPPRGSPYSYRKVKQTQELIFS